MGETNPSHQQRHHHIVLKFAVIEDEVAAGAFDFEVI